MAFNGDTGGFGGGFLTETYFWDVMDYAGANVLASGQHSGTLDGAVSDAKAALAGATNWFIVIRNSSGATVHSEGSDANAGQGKQPPTQGEGGEASGGGSTGGETGGTGEAGTLAWRYRLTKNGADTATSGYTYATREDARDAADALVPPLATRTDDYTIWVEANIPGWTPSSYDRPKNVNDSSNPDNPNQPPTGEPPVIVLPPGDGSTKPPIVTPGGDLDGLVALSATVLFAFVIVWLGWRMLGGSTA